jgi:uncharacterized hydrophobic protein (TIGR00271 family)
VLHLRLIVPVDRADEVVRRLCADPAVALVTRDREAAVLPAGDVVSADVAREAADRIITMLRSLDVHRDGSITIESVDMALSDAAMRAEAAAPGDPTDALVWEEVEARARADATLTPSFVVFMVLAAVIAACGILTDSPVLIVGAMVVGPDFGPVAALCVALVKPRRKRVVRAATTLLVGLGAAAVGAFGVTLLLRAAGVVDRGYELGDRGLTSFISNPDAFSVIVALAAGVVGMLTVTEDRAGALVGVLVSVTTIPAAANIGVAVALGNGEEARGSAAQLAVNVGCLIVAGVVTLAFQRAVWARVQRDPAGRLPG